MDALTTKQIERRFTRALQSYDREALVQQAICRKAAAWLAPWLEERERFVSALEIGCGTGGFTRYLQALLPDARWTLNDLSEPCACEAARRYAAPGTVVCAGDAEGIDWRGRFQLIASSSAVQWFTYPEQWIGKMARLQCEGDLLCFTTFLPGTFREIRMLTGRGLDYPEEAQWLTWLQPSYRPLLLRQGTVKLRFASPWDVLKHLKETGVTATGNEFWTRRRLAAFDAAYREAFSEPDGSVVLTYKPVYFILESIG